MPWREKRKINNEEQHSRVSRHLAARFGQILRPLQVAVDSFPCVEKLQSTDAQNHESWVEQLRLSFLAFSIQQAAYICRKQMMVVI